MVRYTLFTIFISILFYLSSLHAENYVSKTISKIAFGSCANQNVSQPVWTTIHKYKPDLFIFTGDIVYADTSDVDGIRKAYQKLNDKAEYQQIKRDIPIIGVWDDHDYGKNDVGKHWIRKHASEEILLDFLNEARFSKRRQRHGIYTSYYYGSQDTRVQVILLDTRYFRTNLNRIGYTAIKKRMNMGPYGIVRDVKATMLGDMQWHWLQKELLKPAKIRLIVTSTQLIANYNGWEAWANMPHERKRMVTLIKETKASGVVFLTGDPHWAELSMDEKKDIYPLYELTSSGITRVWKGLGPNHRRIEKPYLGVHFGGVEIDWEHERLTLLIQTLKGINVIQKTILFSQLSFKNKHTKPVKKAFFEGTFDTNFDDLNIVQTDDGFTGSYRKGKGKINAVFTKNKLVGTWHESRKWGHFELSLSRDKTYLFGAWNYYNRQGLPYSWQGKRALK